MQVTIDTRHDTLEEALAVIQLAFAGANALPSASFAGPRRTGKTKAVAEKSRSSKSAEATTAPAPRRAPAGKKGATSRVDRRPNIAPPGQAEVVRAWARTQEMQVKPAGRLSAAVVSAYHAAH